MKGSVPARRPRVIRRPAQSAQAPPPLHLRHYKHVYWLLNGGPLVTAYRAVVLHDGTRLPLSRSGYGRLKGLL